MATPDGYVLSEKDVKFLKQLAYTFGRLQHFTNPFGRGPDVKVDLEEAGASTEFYIARSPEGGIAALGEASSDGENHTPGFAESTIFKISQSSSPPATEVVTGFQQRVYNFNTTAIPEDSWMLITRDKYGSWVATAVFAGSASTAIGPGWTAGLSNEDNLMVTVTAKSGKCSTIPNQTIIMTSDDGVVWNGLDNFVYSGGAGVISFERLDNHALPTVLIDGNTLIYEGAGTDNDGFKYIDYMGGTTLCSDVPGTGTGTGGAREDCGGNTFKIRITCVKVSELTIAGGSCNDREILTDGEYAYFYLPGGGFYWFDVPTISGTFTVHFDIIEGNTPATLSVNAHSGNCNSLINQGVVTLNGDGCGNGSNGILTGIKLEFFISVVGDMIIRIKISSGVVACP